MTVPKADLVLKNGNIFLGAAGGFAQSAAVWCDRVLAAGSDSDLEGLIGPDTRVLDLRGRAAIPGFNDGHQHMLSYGLEQLEVSLHPAEVDTLEKLLRRIKAKAETVAPGEWIVARRYDHFHLDVGRHPFREELDQAAPDNPVWITRTCGHMGVANSRALSLAGVDESTPEPEGGHIEQQNGQLTGLLQETAQGLLKSVLPQVSQAELINALETAGDIFLAHGITSVMDAGVGLRQKFEDLLAYFEARRQRRLKVRSYLAMLGGPSGIQERALDAGLLTGQGDEFLKIGSIKLFTDGSAGGKTAAMTLPYVCSCDNRGLLVYRDDELDHWVERYHRLGYQVSIHAIGDAAIDQGLQAVDRAQRLPPTAGRRHRIEHCGFTSPAQIATMARLGMVPAPQPIFLYEFGELYVDVLGEERPAALLPNAELDRGRASPGRQLGHAGLRLQPDEEPLHDGDAQDRSRPRAGRKRKTVLAGGGHRGDRLWRLRLFLGGR